MVDIDELMDEIEGLKLEINALRKEMKNIPPHKHCLNCGAAIPPDKDFCSKKCEDEWKRMIKKKKQFTYIWLIFLAILLLILLLTSGSL